MNAINAYLKQIDDVISKGRFKDNWESLSQFQTPSFLRERRLGIFIHWGVYSVPAYGSEWYPRLMYMKGHPCNFHHKKTYGADFDYSKMVAMFKPEKFNADEWADIFKKGGTGYNMSVDEHHDGGKQEA